MPQSVAAVWGRKPECFASKCANLVIRGPISACVTRYVPCPQSPARVLWPEYLCCHRCLAVKSMLRLKSYLVVKMSSDLVTEHCCQLYVLSVMFAAPTAGCVDIAQSIHLSTTFDFTPAGRQTRNVKNISLHFIFIFCNNRDTSVLELFLVIFQ